MRDEWVPVEFVFGPYHEETVGVKTVNGKLPTYYWTESEVSDGLVMLQRYILKERGIHVSYYQLDSQSFGTKSPYAKTYPNGLTRQQIEEKNSK